MKKKKIYIIILIIVILLVIGVIFVFSNFADKKRIRDKFIYNSWNFVKDEYQTTEPVFYPGEPIPSIDIYFNDTLIEFCSVEELDETEDSEKTVESDEEDIIAELVCKDYEYSIKKDNLIVVVDGKKLAFTYEFVGSDELILTYTGDGYIFKFYYQASAG